MTLRLLNFLKVLNIVVGFLFLCGISSAASIPADQLFPETTQGFISVPNLQELTQRWQKTQIGTLMRDPVMKEFVADAQRQLKERLTDRFGFSVTGIENIAPGELAAGLVTPTGMRPGFVVTLDITGRHQETQDYLKNVGRELEAQGAKRAAEKHAGEEVVIYTFPPEEGVNVPPRHAAFVICKDTLIIADQKPILLFFQARVQSGAPTGNLADVPAYQNTMQRCLSDMPNNADVHLKIFVNPLAYGEAVRTLLLHRLSDRRQKQQSIFSVLSEIGFDAIKGIGAVVSLKTEDLEAVYRVAVAAPKPHRDAMNVISLPNSTEWNPPKWMPRDLARCTLLNVDALTIFDNIGPLFDGVVAQEKGVWVDVLSGLKDDANGPQIDVRSELVAHLGSRVTSMSRYEQPIGTKSESVVIVIALKSGMAPAMAKSLEKLFSNDPQVQKSLYQDCVIWQNNVEEPKVDLTPPQISGLPPLVGAPKTPAPPKPKLNFADDEQPKPVFPQGGVTVAHGNLVIGTNVEYMQTIIDRLSASPESIGDAADYRLMTMVLNQWGVANAPHCYQAFIRTDETIRPSYEMIRQGKMPESEAVMGKIINALLASGDDPPGIRRKQEIDGSKMPEFEYIRRHFGPAGTYGITEDSGWFIKGCLMGK